MRKPLTKCNEASAPTTYFIRHGRKWHIDDATRRWLYKSNTIAIHYQPIASCDPSRYRPEYRRPINTFRTLATEGGVVCATYFPTPGCVIGLCASHSSVKFKTCYSGGSERTKIVLKCLTLSDVRKLDASTAWRVLCNQPRGGAVAQWSIIKGRVAQFHRDGIFIASDVDHFTTAEQEVLCSEFLRSDLKCRGQLPKLHHLLMPVGRTLEDVDIIGLTATGKKLFAQVTFWPRERVDKKIAALKKYEGPNAHLILFCDQAKMASCRGVTLFPIRVALREILLHSPQLAAAMGYDPTAVNSNFVSGSEGD